MILNSKHFKIIPTGKLYILIMVLFYSYTLHLAHGPRFSMFLHKSWYYAGNQNNQNMLVWCYMNTFINACVFSHISY